STINFSRDKSMIIDLEDGLETYSLGDSWGVYLYAKKDRPWGTLVGTGFQYNDNGEALVGADGFPLIAQNQEIGNVMPDWLMGWSNEFSYKNWSFGFLLDYRHGGDLFSQTLMFGAYSGLLDFTAADGVRENGAVFGQNICPDITFVNEDGSPNTTAVDPEDAFMYYFNVNEMSVIDGSFLKLREIHLTYTFPERWVKKMRIISDAKISLVANNVAILWLHKSNLAKIDPESLIGNSTQSMAFETAYMPQTRSIGVKLHLAF
ncbi:MAG: SusC/RagA family TonB-linked outer membrane protein, partial [Bacteroidales bacterium]|nr:SusC/RagA family TonB-linked outer membrane protein [Candidatus Colimorpha onthohippi]